MSFLLLLMQQSGAHTLRTVAGKTQLISLIESHCQDCALLLCM
jgi:flagellar basal body-associated protein FliL